MFTSTSRMPSLNDVVVLHDPVFNVPKTRSAGDFGEFMQHVLEDFGRRIGDFEGPLSRLLASRRPRIDALSSAICAALRLARRGEMDAATDRLAEGLSGVKADLRSISRRHSKRVLSGQCWYRIAAWPGIARRQDMFHTPFEICQPPARFSSPGARALYLANSTYLCWRECGQPPVDQCFVARFEIDTTSQSYLDLACSHAAYIAPLDLTVAGIPELDPMDPRSVTNGPYDADVVSELAEYLTLWPLAAAVSMTRCTSHDDDPVEYLVPHLLMSWIRRSDEFLGVRYFTTRDEPNTNSQDWEINLAIPTRSNRTHGFCQFLSSRIHCTLPVPLWRMADVPFAALASVEAVERREQRSGRVMLGRSGLLQPYCETEFGKAEYFLERPSIVVAAIET